MDERLKKDFRLPEEDLPGLVTWPRSDFTPAEIREIFAKVNRFIDFDGTIAMNGGTAPRPMLRGKPTSDFLAEEPYIVQTWRSDGVIQFFTELYPDISRPVLIIITPAFYSDRKIHDSNLGKNFATLGLKDKTIIDDLHPAKIHAPGCTVLHPDL